MPLGHVTVHDMAHTIQCYSWILLEEIYYYVTPQFVFELGGQALPPPLHTLPDLSIETDSLMAVSCDADICML